MEKDFVSQNCTKSQGLYSDHVTSTAITGVSANTLCIAIVAGGTGGHVFPALAVWQELVQRGHQCVWIGRAHSIESRIAQQHRCPFYSIEVSGVRGRRIDKQIVALWKTLKATAIMYRLFRRGIHQRDIAYTPGKDQGEHAWHKNCKVHVVLGFGGYTSVAAGVAAFFSHTPLVIHEQNSYAGSANRLLARWAKVVCCGFADAFCHHPRRQVVGNPVRFCLQPRWRYDDAPLRICILGGSGGAASLNQAITTSFRALPCAYNLHVVHQCGERTHKQTLQNYTALYQVIPQLRGRLVVRLQPFLHCMPAYYSWCDLVICRAGAITIAEVAMSGKYAIFVPFPFATDDHQFHNCQGLVNAGSADVIRDDIHLADNLTQVLRPLLESSPVQVRQQLHEKGRLGVTCSIAHSSSTIADITEQVAKTFG